MTDRSLNQSGLASPELAACEVHGMTRASFILRGALATGGQLPNFLGVLAAAFWQNKRFDDLEDWFKAELERVCSRRRDTLAAGETALKR